MNRKRSRRHRRRARKQEQARRAQDAVARVRALMAPQRELGALTIDDMRGIFASGFQSALKPVVAGVQSACTAIAAALKANGIPDAVVVSTEDGMIHATAMLPQQQAVETIQLTVTREDLDHG